MEQNNNNKTGSLLVERIANKLGLAADVSHIYGEPVERDGVTVIPVARAAYGFGGGSGTKESEEGSGGGGGISLTPVGYIEIKQGVTKFRPVRDPQSLMKIVAITGLFTYLTARSITSLMLGKNGLKKLKKKKKKK